jgi:hypothetical protein
MVMRRSVGLTHLGGDIWGGSCSVAVGCMWRHLQALIVVVGDETQALFHSFAKCRSMSALRLEFGVQRQALC